MSLYNEVAFTCPCCGAATWEQTRIGDCYGQVINLEDITEDILEALVDPDRKVRCQRCSARIGFVKKIKVELEPVCYDKLPKDPTPEEVARVQEYLARQKDGNNG